MSASPRRGRCSASTTYLQQAQTGVWDVTASFLPAIYIEGVTLAGGIATLLPPQPVDDDIADRVLDGLDGLVITGGKDVDPAHLRPGRRTRTPTSRRSDRDAWEFALVTVALDARAARARNLPRRPGPQRRARRHPAPAPARRRRPLPASGWQRRVQHVVDPDRARHPVGRADRRVDRRAVLPPPGHRRTRSGIDRHRVGSRRRRRSRRDTWASTSSWPCSGIPRNASTICACSAVSSRRPRPTPRARPR